MRCRLKSDVVVADAAFFLLRMPLHDCWDSLCMQNHDVVSEKP